MSQYISAHHYPCQRHEIRWAYEHLGLQSVAPGPHTSKPHPEHTVYPYLLKDLEIERPCQVFSTDITYSVPGAQGEYGYSNEPQVYLKYPVRAQGNMVH